MKLRLIGDIHGDFETYQGLIRDCDRSVQVGDFGIGFVEPPVVDTERHKFIRGNHDNPDLCKETPGWIPDGYFDEDHSIMYIGGAFSIDQAQRTEGVNWWRNEEYTYAESSRLYDLYCEYLPRIMITHDFPVDYTSYMCLRTGRQKFRIPSVVESMFDAMFDEHKPEFWYGGHWHLSHSALYKGTRFRILKINEVVDIEV